MSEIPSGYFEFLSLTFQPVGDEEEPLVFRAEVVVFCLNCMNKQCLYLFVDRRFFFYMRVKINHFMLKSAAL